MQAGDETDPTEAWRPTVSVVIPTKDRPDELSRMLETMAAQTVAPLEVIVVDASEPPVEAVAIEHSDLPMRYLRHLPPSSAQQRNRGLETVSPDATFVMFVDDDVLLRPDALERMFAYFAEAPAPVAGAALNILDAEDRTTGWLRRSALVRGLGLYSATPGDVARSGWQTAAATVDRVTPVRWLSTCAVWWRRDAIRRHRFDPFFVGYSYLEDLDFSLGMARDHDLVVVPDGMLEHIPSKKGRSSRFAFGRMEVENRLYVVRKHGLSVWRCTLTMLLRSIMNLAPLLRGHLGESLGRMAGNVAGFWGRRGLFGRESSGYLERAKSSDASASSSTEESPR